MFNHRRGRLGLVALGFAAATLPGFAAAQTATYVGADGGSWNTASNWSPATVPNGTTAQAIFTNTNSGLVRSVDLGGGSVTVNQIDVQGSGQTDTRSITNGTLRFGGSGARYTNATYNAGNFINPAPLSTLPVVALDAATEFAITFLYGRVDIVNGVSGNSALTKTGPGMLALSGNSTLTGDITVAAGILWIPAGASVPSAAVNVQSALMGAGTLGNVTMQNGAQVEVGSTFTGLRAGTLSAANMTWNGQSIVSFDLAGEGTDQIAIANTLTRGTNGAIRFFFSGQPPAAGQVYTLMTFGAQSGFSLSDFSYQISGPPNSYVGHFVLTANALQFVIDTLPVTLQSFDVD
jgi:autotransporter-associated beta strand protein